MKNGERISDAERDLGVIAGGRSEKRGSEERESNHWFYEFVLGFGFVELCLVTQRSNTEIKKLTFYR